MVDVFYDRLDVLEALYSLLHYTARYQLPGDWIDR
jgi:hypothetical protein